MRTHRTYAAVYAALIAITISFTSKAQVYLVATHKPFYEPNETIEFYYVYPTKHTWTSLWLKVEALSSTGNNLTAAADLGEPGKGSQTYPATRFGTGKFKVTLTSMTDNIGTVMVENTFEIRKERKKYQVGSVELEDDEQKERAHKAKMFIREKTPIYFDALRKYNAVAARMAQLYIQVDNLSKEKISLEVKIGRARRKITEDKLRRDRQQEIRELLNNGNYPEDQKRKLVYERDSLTKLINDNISSISLARAEVTRYTTSLQAVDIKLKNLASRPIPEITSEMELAKDKLKEAGEDLHEAEIHYYDNKALSSVEEIAIQSGSNIVYRASWSWKKDLLLQQLLNDLKKDSANAAEAKNKALALFLAAKKEEIEAGNKLGGPTGAIMKAAYWGTAIEGIFHTIDVGQAWIKGGPAAAFAESAKKLAQAYLKGDLSLSTSPFQPGTIEAEMFREYDVMSVNPHRPDEINAHIALVKEEQEKRNLTADRIQSGAGKAIDWIVDKIKDRSLEAEKTIEVMSKVDKWAEFLGGQVGTVVDYAKDKLKDTLLKWAKLDEQKAWMDYILKGRKARFLYAPYVVAANHYRKVDSFYHAVLANYAEYVNSVASDPTGPFNVQVNKEFFEDDQLQLIITRRKGTNEFKDRIVLGGTEATYTSPHQFKQLIGPKLDEDKGKVRLQLYVFKKPMNGWNPSSYEQ